MKKYAPYVFIISLYIGITAPSLWTDGMFTDGAIYSVIARNSAFGNSGFWHLKFSETIMNPFYGHPPLVFFLESLVYRIFGEGLIVERLYSFLTGISVIILIFIISNKIFPTKNNRAAFLSTLLFLMFPLVSWSFSNNMLENTVSVFVLLSFLLLLKSYSVKRYTMLFLSGIFLFGGFMSKGFTALFIWSVPLFYYIIFRKSSLKRMFSDTILFIVFTVLPFLILMYFSENARNFFDNYFNEQIIGSIKNVKTVSSRLFIISSLLNEMIIPTVLFIIIYIIAAIKKTKINLKKDTLKIVLFFFLISLSGILPMMISLKQRSFYIVPALPFLAISFGFLFNEILEYFQRFIMIFKKRIFVFISYILLGTAFAMIFLFAGKPGRDKIDISDVKLIKEIVPEGEILTISKSLYKNWSMYAYMQRYGKYSLSKEKNNIWLLSGNNDFTDSTVYRKINLKLKKYTLSKKIK